MWGLRNDLSQQNLFRSKGRNTGIEKPTIVTKIKTKKMSLEFKFFNELICQTNLWKLIFSRIFFKSKLLSLVFFKIRRFIKLLFWRHKTDKFSEEIFWEGKPGIFSKKSQLLTIAKYICLKGYELFWTKLAGDENGIHYLWPIKPQSCSTFV